MITLTTDSNTIRINPKMIVYYHSAELGTLIKLVTGSLVYVRESVSDIDAQLDDY